MKSFPIKGNVILAALITALIIAMIGLGPGCKEDSAQDEAGTELKAGYIDSDRLLDNYSDYRIFLVDKEKHAQEMRELLSSGKELTDSEKEKIKKTTLEYMKTEEGLIRKFVETVREASRKVCDAKKLDMVINNPSSNSVLEFGGIDITSEVQAKISQMESEGKANKKDTN